MAPDPIVLDANRTATVTLANESGVELVTRASVVGEDGSPVERTRVVPRRRVLPAGATEQARIRGSAAAEGVSLVVVADPVSGTLPAGAVVRVAVRATAAAKPAVDAWTVRSVLAGGDQGLDLPLDGTCAALGSGAKRATLHDDGVAVTVTGSCASAGATSLRLDTGSVPWQARKYEGKLELGESEVTLAVAATSSWWIALGLIALGLGVALAATRWTGWGRDANRLLRDTYVLEQLVADGNPHGADNLFQAAAATENLPEAVQGWVIGPEVQRKLAALRSTIRSWRSPEESERTDMRAKLDTLDALVHGWPAVAIKLGELQHRIPRLRELSAYTARVAEETLQRPSSPGLDDIAELEALTEEAVGLANDWPADAIAQTRNLAATLDPGHAAVAALDSVLKRFAAAPDVDSAKTALDDFWDADREVRAAVHDAAADRDEARNLIPEAGAVAVTDIFSPGRVEDPKAAAGAYAVRIFLVDAAITIALSAAALVGGMQALWIDKEFGGFWDFAAALVWGLGAGAVVVPLSTALGQLGESLLVVRSNQ